MRIRSLNIRNVIFYPNILNPLMWVGIILGGCAYLLFGWWKTEKIWEGKKEYIKFKRDQAGCLKCKRDIFEIFILTIVNSFWFNKKKSDAYADYVSYKMYCTYPLGDWRRAQAVSEKYSYYISVKEKKW